MAKFLGPTGLTVLWSRIKAWVKNYAYITSSTSGGITTNTITIDSKSVTVPSKTSDLNNDAGFITGADIPEGAAASSATPLMDGTASAGTSNAFARGDHRHPSDTTKADKPTGTVTAGNLASLDANGNLVDSGVSASNAGTDTKNTAGATDSSSKMFVVGATAQTANPQTYTQDTVWIGTDGKLHSGVSGTNPTATQIINSTVVTNSDITYDMSQAGSDVIAIIDKTTGKVKPSGDSFDSLLQDYPNKVNGVSPNSSQALVNLATCSTAANTIAKTASLSSGGTLYLETGTQVVVKFENKNTASSPTLNIDNKGAKEIHINGSAISGELNAGVLNNYVLLEYDGTYWNIVGPTTTDSIIWDGGGTVFDSNNSLSGCLTQLNSDMHTLTGRAIKTVAYDTTTHTITTTKVPNGSTAQNVVTAATIVADGGGLTSADKGVANGIAPLDANSKIDAQYLPSYVDDVVEAYIRSNQTALSSGWLATGSASGTAITPESGKIYIIMNGNSTYPTNSEYRWSGSTYVQLYDGGCTEMTESEMNIAVMGSDTSTWT